MKNGDKPAHPHVCEGLMDLEASHATGLTKRELISAMILQGMVSGYDPESKANGRYIPSSDYPELAFQSTQLADELLKQLEA